MTADFTVSAGTAFSLSAGSGVTDDPSSLTPEWVTAALRSAGHDVLVRAVTFERIGTGQIGASYRLHLDATGPVPATLVAKLAAGSSQARERVSEGYRKEVRFYADLAALVAINTPTCWYAAISDDCQSFTLLLEDLAPAVPGQQAHGCRPDQAVAAVQNLAGLHAPLWCNPLLHDHADWLRPMDEATGAFLGELMVGATEQFVERYATRLGAANVETLRRSAALIGRWSTTNDDIFAVMHGDYRLDNLMFAPEGSAAGAAGAAGVAAVDWQTATTGPPARDLSYFLGTSLSVDLRRTHEREMVEVYVEALKVRGVDYPLERCFEDYRLGVMQGPLITVLGCIYATAEPSAASDDMFMAMASRSCTAIRDLATLELLEEPS
jgi:aminoglycoside/choline kinase family phosphotransferase